MRKYRTVILVVSKAAMALWFITVGLTGCIPIGATRFPEPSANFVARKDYPASFEAAWKVVHGVLENNRIVVANENRNEGRITTEYVQGQGQMDGFGLLGVISTRYRYAIRISRVGSENTTINVLANLESSGNKMPAWRDISNDNRGIVTTLENWLYEQIQKRLLSDEY